VREAALGKCHKYDIRTAMFSHMLEVICKEFPQYPVKSSYIWEYSTRKTGVRKELAQQCILETAGDLNFKIKLIKKCLAAVGFGSTVSNPRGAITQTIWHARDRQRLLDHPFVVGLLKEVELYRNIMKKSYPSALREYGSVLRKNGRSSLSKWCSFEYQLTESATVQHVLSKIPPDAVLLVVHDAVYTNKNIDLGDINTWAHDISPMMNFEYEKINKIHINKAVEQRAIIAEQQHQFRIDREEHSAKLWAKQQEATYENS